MMKKTKVVILGDLLYDCFTWAPRLPRKGETVMGYANGFFSGGKGANQAVQAAKLGAEVYLIGKVGSDERGDFLLKELNRYGVNTDYVFRDPMEATGTCCIHVDANGDNAIIVAPLANLKVTEEEVTTARQIIEGADVFITQLLLDPHVTLMCLKWASDAGVITVFNPAPAREIPDEFYRYSHFISPNETEAEYFTGCYKDGQADDKWRENAGSFFRNKGCKALLMTLGSDGVYYDDGVTRQSFPCFKVKAVDCTGAGDSFNAAFAVGVVRSNSLKEALAFASAAAALTVQGKGAQPSMPMIEQVKDFLNKNRKIEETNMMEINRYLDHAILNPEFTIEEVKASIKEAIGYEVQTVCVRGCDIPMAVEMCKGTNTNVCCVLDFPHGHGGKEAKAAIADIYSRQGAKEVDMVINYGFARSGAWDKVEDEIRAVCENVHKNGGIVKVIFETSQLTLEEVARATEASIAAGADFVKTSTGFNGGGATEEAVRVMLDTAKGRIKVKPSGGIRDYERAKMFVEMGADRLGVGCNSTRKICEKLAPAAADTGSY